MNIEIIKSNTLQKATWAQGSTTEYFIYPKESDYQKRDFLFRLSSATIDSQPALFTNFTNYLRYLLMLDNSLSLEINNEKISKEKYEIVTFKSDDKVTSYATGKDFNLMVSDEIIESGLFLKDDHFENDSQFIFVFALEPTNVSFPNVNYYLDTHDCLIIENTLAEKVKLTLSQKSVVGFIKL